ncbi:50S ribosomal protein L11 [Candidatus Wolfebacteria bacterium RIFCSPHIGHO2_01_FULL_48_22]|uniref:Large ribosomal subunit protein uL11 n=2 Tax=Candidatus Wolfeibacteriota TaxID=1752735 RepID=A0A1F8DRL4_9BACT|nr:MAG: 50S ribosomal protein L11 [Candidatus Wolfebacteria bacterium RIFCSPHIGHO2_01_FULL_48_22]OGM92230.1 MAG: 50S ribosomal protein L11 [Candidatus Wolfebacteria bacterium RIFCSPLOWO2_01_FULL_47_17b]
MAKAIKTKIKIQLPAGTVNPGPPVGTSLGPHGINLGQFCQQFNDATKEMTGSIVPAVITVYEDRSFDFVLKTPPASDLLKKAAGVEKGAGDILKQKVGSVTKAQLKEIAEKKKADLNAYDVEQAMKIVAGTARSMGIEVKE